MESEKKENSGCFFWFIGGFPILSILLLTYIVDWSWWLNLVMILVLFIFTVIVILLIAIIKSLDNTPAKEFEQRKKRWKKCFANDNNLQKQKDEFISKEKELKISKYIQVKDIDFDDVKRSTNNLAHPPKLPKQNFSSLTCPDCGEKPFWIIGEKPDTIMDKFTCDLEIRYYALCSKCAQVVDCFDEILYDPMI